MSEEFPESVAEAEIDALDDPDLRAADSSLEEPDDPDSLSTDTLERDEQDDVWEPDQHLSNATAELIVNDDPDSETLDQRLAQEVPDVGAEQGAAVDSERDYREV
ncbi:hypothetical protein ACFFKU_10470 [Kineococcus gynurae]|uniref:DUF5709 domain-containing protein n=1 Tax=Kineococcus gynurae TaxID=452979 RepID=A0ABV5LUX6_9ACTN